jgi:hypothetical protein
MRRKSASPSDRDGNIRSCQELPISCASADGVVGSSQFRTSPGGAFGRDNVPTTAVPVTPRTNRSTTRRTETATSRMPSVAKTRSRPNALSTSSTISANGAASIVASWIRSFSSSTTSKTRSSRSPRGFVIAAGRRCSTRLPSAMWFAPTATVGEQHCAAGRRVRRRFNDEPQPDRARYCAED